MAAKLPESNGKEISLLLFGKTGHGKSATGNTILGWEAFAQSDRAASKTTTSSLHCAVREDGTTVRVVDSPGVMDTEKQEESIIAEMMEGMGLCPKGFNALVFVIKFGIRYTEEEIESLETLKKYFGSNFLTEFGIVVMTQGDSFALNHEEDNLTFENWLMANEHEEQCGPFDKLLKECSNRVVLFYNSGEAYIDERKQCVEKLFELVEQIPKVYTSDHVALASIAREEIAKQLKAPVLYTAIQEKLSSLMEQIEKDLRNKTFSYKFMRKKIEALNEEVEKECKKHEENLSFSLFQKSLHTILPRVEVINNLQERKEQRAEQKRLLRDLKSLKEPPDKLGVVIRGALCSFAKMLVSIDNVVTLGKLKPLLETWLQKWLDSYERRKAIYLYKKSLDEEKDNGSD